MIDRCRKGDIKSCELLYNRYSHAMYHTCLRIVANVADAEDILQDAFLEAFTGLGRLKNKEAFGGWLKRIVINKAMNFVNRKKQDWRDVDLTDDVPNDESSVDEVDFEARLEAVKEAISRLPDKYRVIIHLHIFEKMAFEEIAALMEMPAATVRSQYLRGKQKIITMVTKQ